MTLSPGLLFAVNSFRVNYRRMDFLLPTLVYITVGLWLTTALVEQLVDVFRIVHYAGRKITQYKDVMTAVIEIDVIFQLTVWLGNQKLTVGGLITTVCRRVGMSDAMISEHLFYSPQQLVFLQTPSTGIAS